MKSIDECTPDSPYELYDSPYARIWRTTQKDEITTQKSEATTQKKILAYLHNYPKATRKEAADALGDITEDGVKFNIGLLQQYGALKRKGGRKNGEWEVNPDYFSEFIEITI